MGLARQGTIVRGACVGFDFLTSRVLPSPLRALLAPLSQTAPEELATPPLSPFQMGLERRASGCQP